MGKAKVKADDIHSLHDDSKRIVLHLISRLGTLEQEISSKDSEMSAERERTTGVFASLASALEDAKQLATDLHDSGPHT